MIVEWYALKCFALGGFFTGVTAWRWVKYKYGVKHFEIDRILKLKKPEA